MAPAFDSPYPRIVPVGDAALTIELGDIIDLAINQRVFMLEQALQTTPAIGVIDLVPTYRSLLVLFDPCQVDFQSLSQHINDKLRGLSDEQGQHSREVNIPVHYGGENGPDLAFVAEHNQLTSREVIEIHTSQLYPVYMMGFTPGFPYLGGMDERIAAPRLASPRTLVKAGSVGIAGQQTGIYPIDSPGGWRIIGKTEFALFDPAADQPFALSPGDLVRFVPLQEDHNDD
jgi:KipI family sensor histidine kinase inhibitor